MKLLDYLQNITDSDEEFLEIIKEMNRWVKDKKNENRIIHVPHNIKRFAFSRDEYKKALELSTQAIRRRKTYRTNQQKLSQHGQSQNTSNSLLFW